MSYLPSIKIIRISRRKFILQWSLIIQNNVVLRYPSKNLILPLGGNLSPVWEPLVYSNASTSLKNPLLVRVWPMCLSVKLHLCRILFMLYKITWLVRIHLCRLVGIRLNCKVLVLTSKLILSAKLYLLWRVFIIRLANFAKPAWCSNSGKFVRSRVNMQVYTT